MLLKHVIDNKVDIIDNKTTENRLLHSSYNLMDQEKTGRIEEEVMVLRKEVSGISDGMLRILDLLEKPLPSKQNNEKLDIDRQWDACIHIDQGESVPYIRSGSVVRTGLFVHSQISNPMSRKTWPLDGRRRSLHI